MEATSAYYQNYPEDTNLMGISEQKQPTTPSDRLHNPMDEGFRKTQVAIYWYYTTHFIILAIASPFTHRNQ